MNKIFPLMLALILTACGFHLRGSIDTPKWLHDVCILSEVEDKQLLLMLKSQLEAYDINVHPIIEEANYLLVINQANLEQHIISVGASTNPRQYQLNFTVVFMLQTSKGQIVQAPRKIMVSRQLTVNNDRILGSNEEESVILSEMRRDAVRQIINRLGRDA